MTESMLGLPPAGPAVKATRRRNIKLIYMHIICFTIFQSICQWNLFDAYLSFLATENGFINSNTWVGFAEGIIGITTLLLALPLGLIVDAYDRIAILRVAGTLGLLATAISAYSFWFDNLVSLYSNLVLWGAFIGLQGTAAEAIFADSVEMGKRSEKFTIKGVLNTCGLSLGPALMLVLFVFLDDQWNLSHLHIPLLLGCLFAPVACLPFFMIEDPLPNTVVEAQAPGVPARPRSASSLSTPLLRNRSCDSPNACSACATFTKPSSQTTPCALRRLAPPSPCATASQFSIATGVPKLTTSWGDRAVPYILTVADFITEIGAGMTIRFFPLFFIHDYGVAPIGLCAIFCVYPLCVAMAMPVCQRISRIIGRAQASFIFQFLGVLMLLWMTQIENIALLVVVFMLRGQLQNGAYPLDRSILMDYIPSKHRGKWTSIASLTTMTWSGSAVLGGYLADKHDYRFTFLITAAIYTLGIVAYLPLMFLVPQAETVAALCDSDAVEKPTASKEVRAAATRTEWSDALSDTRSITAYCELSPSPMSSKQRKGFRADDTPGLSSALAPVVASSYERLLPPLTLEKAQLSSLQGTPTDAVVRAKMLATDTIQTNKWPEANVTVISGGASASAVSLSYDESPRSPPVNGGTSKLVGPQAAPQGPPGLDSPICVHRRAVSSQ